jgi:murein DD-endopeptidase MepM/ murein hydrolase activator NlpD
LKVLAKGLSPMLRKGSLLFIFLELCLLSHCANAADTLQLLGQPTQGSLLRGRLLQGSALTLDGHPVKLSAEGYFAFGFGRDDDLKHTLSWRNDEGEQVSRTIELTARQYQVQKIEGLPSKYVSPPKEVLDRIKQDSLHVATARKRDDDRIDFMQSFIWPAEGPISGVYGSQRVLNGEAKSPHYGVDVAGPVGTAVYAPADGVVTLFEADMYYSGGTMIIDHGHGVSSTFLHMSKAHVEPGTVVKQGQLVGEIGNTGRATGAHLDWRLNWFAVRLDPALLVPARQID